MVSTRSSRREAAAAAAAGGGGRQRIPRPMANPGRSAEQSRCSCSVKRSKPAQCHSLDCLQCRDTQQLKMELLGSPNRLTAALPRTAKGSGGCNGWLVTRAS